MINGEMHYGVPESLRVAHARASLAEPLIDAQAAVEQLSLQRYWLTHPQERLARQIPHYRIGKMVRFRLSELLEWMYLADCAPDRFIKS